MIAYLDSSVILRRLLNQANALPQWGEWDHACTSELTRVEAFRKVDHLRIQGGFTEEEVAVFVEELEEVLGHFSIIPLQKMILDRASLPLPSVVGTLDAIHIASALVWRERRPEEIVFFTHDAQQGTAAKALALKTGGFTKPLPS